MNKLSTFDEWYQTFCAMKVCADKNSEEYQALSAKCAELKDKFNAMFKHE